MAGSNQQVKTCSPEFGQALKERLLTEGFEFGEAAHALWTARGQGVNVVLYASGKLVIQGRGTEDFCFHILQDLEGPRIARLQAATIGSDETGKGDTFGPLVVTAALVSPEIEVYLDVPLVDSKALSDRAATEAAERLAEILPHETVVIMPRRYNELYASFRNLNRLLAWAHAKAVATLFARERVKHVVIDRFTDEATIRGALGPLADEFDLEVRPRAEDNPAVAAASILARKAFLEQLDRLSKRAGFPLPKGSGAPVAAAARRLRSEVGAEGLSEFGKLHFQTLMEP